MNHPDLDLYIQQARRGDDLAAAAHSRLLKEALQAGPRRAGRLNLRPLAVLLAQAMAWLGSLLTSWSCSLQSRYITDSPSNPCANA